MTDTETTEVNVDDLYGIPLDWAVAQVFDIGVTLVVPGNGNKNALLIEDNLETWEPSTEWCLGGFILETVGVWLSCEPCCEHCENTFWAASIAGDEITVGETALIAVCRAVVKSVYGDHVEIPVDIMHAGGFVVEGKDDDDG